MYWAEFIIPFQCETLVNTPSKHDVDSMLVQCWPTVCDAGSASNQHWFNAWCFLGCVQPSKHLYSICTMLDQRRRCWADVLQMLYKCFVFSGNSSWSGIAYCWWRLQADTTQCLLNDGPASPMLASIHSVLASTSCCGTCMLAVRTRCFEPKLG